MRRCYSNPKLVMKRSRAFRRPYPAKALTPHNNPKRIAISKPDAYVVVARPESVTRVTRGETVNNLTKMR